jgi:hypothetical protein
MLSSVLLRFEDRDGRAWEVWEVRARLAAADRPVPAAAGHTGPERWLCFDSGTERRRLTNYPTSWHAMSPSGLDALCRAASPSRLASAPRSSGARGERPAAEERRG